MDAPTSSVTVHLGWQWTDGDGFPVRETPVELVRSVATGDQLNVVPASFAATVHLEDGRAVGLLIDVAEDLLARLTSFRMVCPAGQTMAPQDVTCLQGWVDDAVAAASRTWSLKSDDEDTAILRNYRKRDQPGPRGFEGADRLLVKRLRDEGLTWADVRTRYGQQVGRDTSRPEGQELPSIPTLKRWVNLLNEPLEADVITLEEALEQGEAVIKKPTGRALDPQTKTGGRHPYDPDPMNQEGTK
jgi:hypothetical protein